MSCAKMAYLLPRQEVDLLRFTPALLPIQPSTKAVDISYGFAGESSRIDIGQEVQVLLDTPYNVRSVNGGHVYLAGLWLVVCVSSSMPIRDCDRSSTTCRGREPEMGGVSTR